MSLSDNLAKLSKRRDVASSRRRGTLATLVEIAAERQQQEVSKGGSSNALFNMTPTPVAGTPVAGGAGHSADDGHNHGASATQTDRLGNKGGFDPQFDSALKRLLADFGGKVRVNSGYRSPERQAQLYAAALKKYGSPAAARKWVAPPGKSNHGRGLAADLGYADAATRRLVHQRAREYGLHFPLSNENWHIEPLSARRR